MQRRLRLFEVVLAALALLMFAGPLTVQGTPLKHNFVALPEVDVVNGQAFAMSVHLTNDAPLQQVTVPLLIRLADYINIDSISFAGSRFNGFGSVSSQIDNGGHTMLIDFAANPRDEHSPSFLPAGEGKIATLYLKVAQNIPPNDVFVDTTDLIVGKKYLLEDTAGAQVADYWVYGLIHIISRRPVIHLDPTVFNFTTHIGDNPATQIMQITNLGEDPLNWHISHKPSWLKLSSYSGAAPNDVTLEPLVSTYPVGELHDSVAVTDTFAVEKTVWAFVNVTILDIPLPNVAGYVKDTLGANIAGATVELWDSYPGGSLLFTTTTDALGKFGFFLIPNGDYDLYCYKDGYYPTTRVITSPDDNIQVILVPMPSEITKCIALHNGWNLVSWNVDTPDDNIETLIANIKGCIDVILGFEQGGATYDPFLPQFSTLDALDHLHGYWFRMNCDTTLCVTGQPIATDSPIELEPSWNLVSYLPNSSDSTAHAIGSVLDKLVVALGFDYGGLTYDPAYPGFATLIKMKPDFGYWLKTTAAATLIYPTPLAKRSIYSASPGGMKSYQPASGVTATPEWVDLFGDGITLDGLLIPAGAILASYDENGHLCGQAIVEPGGKISFTPVYRDDKSTQAIEGPDFGGQINLTLNGAPVQESYIFGGLGDRIRLTNLTSLSKANGNVPRNFELAQNYPNPFNPGTSIQFSLPMAARATVDVYNVVGERVATLLDRLLPAGRYSVSWDGADINGKSAASGVYFYRLRAGEFSETKKMMLVK